MVLLCALTFVVVEGMAVQVGGQVASLVFGGHRLVPGGVGAGTGIFLTACASSGRPGSGVESGRPGFAARTRGPVGLTARHAAGRCRARHRDHPLVRHLRAASGSQHGGPARASRAHVERHMGRKSVERHTAAL